MRHNIIHISLGHSDNEKRTLVSKLGFPHTANPAVGHPLMTTHCGMLV